MVEPDKVDFTLFWKLPLPQDGTENTSIYRSIPEFQQIANVSLTNMHTLHTM